MIAIRYRGENRQPDGLDDPLAGRIENESSLVRYPLQLALNGLLS